jgi:electron transfer flavoprotein beta subunit
MRVVACVKQVLDTTVALRVVDGAVRQEAPRPIVQLGAADRAALEAALALGAGDPVTAVSIGEAEAVDALRFCLARGAGRALHVVRAGGLDPIGAATAVVRALEGAVVEVVVCGAASGDGGSGLFPAVVGAELGWPLVTNVVAIARADGGRLRVERRLEHGDREVVRCPLPAVLAVEAAAAEPRYVSLAALRRAARARIETIQADGAGAASGCEILALELPKPRPRRGSGPDARLSAMDRLNHLMTGGLQQKRSGGLVEGSPQTVAGEVVRFLAERGFVDARTRRGHG